jgi:predicted nucleic acid-binding Zn finger protein
MNDYETSENESTDLSDRTRRALERPFSVVSRRGTPIDDADVTIVQVVSNSGESYTVDVREARCECRDYEYRADELGEEGCKHVHRARYALGVEPIDGQVLDAVDVDDTLGANAPGPEIAATDGGVAVETDTESASVRPTYVVLGVDERGGSHVYDTETETVHIVHDDGSRGRRVIGETQTVDDWMDAVEDGWSWANRRYGAGVYVDRIAAVGGLDR